MEGGGYIDCGPAPLGEQDRKSILSDVSIEYFAPGEIILEQGTMNHPGLYVVESGLVRLNQRTVIQRSS